LYVLTKKSIKLIIEEYGSYQFHENYRSRWTKDAEYIVSESLVRRNR
jgi:hypothetical protein